LGPGGGAAHSFGEALVQLAADFAATDTNIGQGFMRRRLPEWTETAAQAANQALDGDTVTIAPVSTDRLFVHLRDLIEDLRALTGQIA
jgi:hypothetical protein